jgi:murein L,D-transpeptidase YcbB/YkuD
MLCKIFKGEYVMRREVKLKIAAAGMCALMAVGCTGPKDAEGWNPEQKREFMKILASDTYLSVCEQAPLYEKVKERQNSRLMTRLLVEYTENLANSCIDPDTIGEYDVYRQKVSRPDIVRRLRAGQSIQSILKPYVPEYAQFKLLAAQYRALKRSSGISADILRKVRLNIERVKLMKPGFGNTYALVNIPEYRVRIIENGKTSLVMGVIVGQRKKQTPIFSEDLQYIVLNPTWNVPNSIARNEVIPKLLKDPDYLKKHRLVMRKDYNLHSPALTPSSVDLEAYKGGKGEVPFKFIEIPSDKNALGRVKFIFPNHHSVYMHDTPTKYLFKRKVRTFSHGCVRLERPKEMLKYLTEHYTNYSYDEAKKMYDSYKTHYMKIVKRLPVHTAYLTAYVDEGGKLLLFADIYGFDRSQELTFQP